MDSDLRLSVILIIGDYRGHAVNAVQSILHQHCDSPIELVIVDVSQQGTPPLVEGAPPEVRVIRLDSDTTFGEAAAQAVRAARAPVVAFIEEHCVALHGFASAIIKAHEGPWAGVGAEIHNGNPGIGLSDAFYLMGYTPWMPPGKKGEVTLINTHNSSYKRDLLLELGDDLNNLLMVEPLLQWQLMQNGHRLFFESDAKLLHLSEPYLRSLKAYYLWNQCFGDTRARLMRWSWAKRLLYLISSPIIPFIRAGRLFLMLVRKQPHRLYSYFANLPPILLIMATAVFGLAHGILFGAGDAETRFTRAEFSEKRL